MLNLAERREKRCVKIEKKIGAAGSFCMDQSFFRFLFRLTRKSKQSGLSKSEKSLAKRNATLLSSHLLVRRHPVQKSKFGACAVTGYCSFKKSSHYRSFWLRCIPKKGQTVSRFHGNMYSPRNDPDPEMSPNPEMIPKSTPKWSPFLFTSTPKWSPINSWNGTCIPSRNYYKSVAAFLNRV